MRVLSYYPMQNHKRRPPGVCSPAVLVESNKTWNIPTTAFEWRRMADPEGRYFHNRDIMFLISIEVPQIKALVSFA